MFGRLVRGMMSFWGFFRRKMVKIIAKMSCKLNEICAKAFAKLWEGSVRWKIQICFNKRWSSSGEFRKNNKKFQKKKFDKKVTNIPRHFALFLNKLFHFCFFSFVFRLKKRWHVFSNPMVGCRLFWEIVLESVYSERKVCISVEKCVFWSKSVYFDPKVQGWLVNNTCVC